MSTAKKTVNIEEVVRITSLKGKLYLALKDGKKHTVASVKPMLTKAGLSGHYAGIMYALGRVLRSHFGKQIVLTDRGTKTATMQIVPYAKPTPQTAGRAKVAAKTSASKSKTKSKSSKSTTASKKSHTPKAEAVAVAAE